MYWIYLGVGVGMVVMIMLVRCLSQDEKIKGESIGAGILSIIMFSLIGACIGMFVGHREHPAHYVFKETMKLVAVRDSSSINGSFIMGGGSIYSGWKYVFYVANKDGSIEMESAGVDSAKIFEDGEKNPHVDIMRDDSADVSNGWVLLPHSYGDQYVFHIPPGSIVRQFKMDLDK